MRRRSQTKGCMQLAMDRSAYKKIYPIYLVIEGNYEGIADVGSGFERNAQLSTLYSAPERKPGQ